MGAHIDSNGNFWSGNNVGNVFANANPSFYVTDGGFMYSESGEIGGITIDTGGVEANYSAINNTGFRIDSGGNAVFNNVTVRGTLDGVDITDDAVLGIGGTFASAPSGNNRVEIAATSPTEVRFLNTSNATTGTLETDVFDILLTSGSTTTSNVKVTSGILGEVELMGNYINFEQGSGLSPIVRIAGSSGTSKVLGTDSSGRLNFQTATTGGVYSSFIQINGLTMNSGYNFDIVGSGNISVSTSSNPHQATISTSAASVGASGGLNGSSSNAARYDHSHNYASSSHGIHMPSGTFTTGTGFLSGSGSVSSSGVISVSGTSTRNGSIFTQHHYPTTGSSYNLGHTADGLYWQRLYAAQSTYVSSDQRLKTEIIDIPYGLDYINSLSPKQYEMIRRIGTGCNTCDTRLEDDAVECNVCEENGDTADIVNNFDYTGEPIGKKHFGFLAQDLISTPPEPDLDIALVDHDIEHDSYVVAHDEFIAPLVKAVQELSTQISELTARVEALEG